MESPHHRIRVPQGLQVIFLLVAVAVVVPAHIALTAARLQEGSAPSGPPPSSQSQQTPPPGTAPPGAAPQGQAPAQQGGPPAQGGGQNGAPPATPATQSEMTTLESSPAFRVNVNLVLVRVIVRDGKGNVVRGLKRDDFKLFDGRKPQTISQFAVESADAKPANAPAGELSGAIVPGEERPLGHRYLALYFDDVNAELSDLQRARLAATRFLDTALQPGDRAGIFTSSGFGDQDFTGDEDKLHEAMGKLLPRPVYLARSPNCPDIDHYQAYQIVEQDDSNALNIAARETLHCFYNDNLNFLVQATSQAEGEAAGVLNGRENQAQYTMRGLEGLIRRMQVLPGRRSVVMASPGFFSLDAINELDRLIDLALRGSVVVSTLDLRGLYTPPELTDMGSDDQVVVPQVDGQKQILRETAAQLNGSTLSQIADATGGSTFQNNNDLYEGFRRTAGLPEVAYLLGFAPTEVKPDGQFHKIRVEVAGAQKYLVQSRRGYFAARKDETPEQQAEEEIREAVFSQDEESAVPIDLHTQFFKPSATTAKLSVLTHVDVRRVRFVRQEDRNADELLIVSVVFDRDGNYVQGMEKRITLRLRDASRAELEKTGITSKVSFDVSPGTYMVRAVVRDSSGDQISTMNRTVEIPN